MTETHTLKNGVTVLLTPDSSARTACVLVGVSVGANHEKEHEHGLAHFFEHMCFKGTETYPDHTRLLMRMDASGLVSNAYTDREYTAYYLHGRSERVRDMIELTADIFLRSLFPADELEKEKGVIIEEIAMYEDDPFSKAEIEVEKVLFKGTAAEHSTLGTPESVSSFSREDFIRFLKKQYVTGNTVISVAGGFDRNEVLSLLEELYAGTVRGGHTDQISVSLPDVGCAHKSIVRENLEQMSIVIGRHAPSVTHDDLYAAKLFSVIIGGSLSSRLFLRVREELGACYSIEAHHVPETHYGSFFISTGVNGKRVTEVVGAIAQECALLSREPVSVDELEKAREYALGVRAVRRESPRGVAARCMHEYARTGSVISDGEHERRIRAVTPEDILRVSSAVLTAGVSACYVGKTAVGEDISALLTGA